MRESFENRKPDGYLNEEDLQFFRDPQEKLRAIMNSLEEGTSIGVKAAALGERVVVTGVQNVLIDEGETVVVLKPYDSSGYILPATRLRLSEISIVMTFLTRFPNPILDNLDREKTWFF